MIPRLLACLACLACLVAGDPPPAAGRTELHGVHAGQRFWLRLNPPNAEYGGNRMLELVYTPPTPAQSDGVHLPDVPFLLLDDQLRLVALNGRDNLCRILHRGRGYVVTREKERPIDDGPDAKPGAAEDVAPTTDERQVAGPRGWDERLAPFVLALAWRSGSRGQMPTYDLFGAAPVASATTWEDTKVVISGRPCTAVADAQGRLARLDDAAGKPLLSITAWIAP